MHTETHPNPTWTQSQARKDHGHLSDAASDLLVAALAARNAAVGMEHTIRAGAQARQYRLAQELSHEASEMFRLLNDQWPDRSTEKS